MFGLGFLFFFMKKHKLCHIHRVLEQRQEGAFHILATDSKNPSLCQVCQLWLPASVRFCPLSMRALKLGHMLGGILVKSTRLAQAITIKWRENVRQTLKARVSVNWQPWPTPWFWHQAFPSGCVYVRLYSNYSGRQLNQNNQWLMMIVESSSVQVWHKKRL